MQLAPERIGEILLDPTFKRLTSARAKLRWGLSFVTVTMFFGSFAWSFVWSFARLLM